MSECGNGYPHLLSQCSRRSRRLMNISTGGSYSRNSFMSPRRLEEALSCLHTDDTAITIYLWGARSIARTPILPPLRPGYPRSIVILDVLYKCVGRWGRPSMWLFVISANPHYTRCTRNRLRRPTLVNNQGPTETSRTKSFRHYIVIDDIKFESLRPDFALSEITSGESVWGGQTFY